MLTNNHVISGATDISAFDVGNAKPTRRRVGYDRTQDIACCSCGVRAFAHRRDRWRGRSRAIVALGNTGGRAERRARARAGGRPQPDVQASDALTGAEETLNGLIQVDAAIRPGDSGGRSSTTKDRLSASTRPLPTTSNCPRAAGLCHSDRPGDGGRHQIRSGGGSPTCTSDRPPSSAWRRRQQRQRRQGAASGGDCARRVDRDLQWRRGHRGRRHRDQFGYRLV
ncbi:putative serine protease PepA [Mycobacterium kansasii]|uniref:Putative serine protease PepA n=1 Tax=Mycobacterium kansasii TaxID=1768 RepID=A0A1V3W9I3_MYCKA|nr:putative serine protease PepA [Mycobacterium kansasii]